MKRKIIIICIICVIFFLGAYYLRSGKDDNSPAVNQSMEEKPLVRVGDEIIYQHDMEAELAYYPQNDDPDIRTSLKEKLITDSIVLQGGQEDGLITLDDTIFNSPKKDYQKRLHSIEGVKYAVGQRSKALKGSVISVWFRNNDYIGPLGLEESKQKAFEVISGIREKVLSKSLSMEEAGNMIIADTSLKEIDPAWRNNAMYRFESGKNTRLTLSPELDEELRTLPIGEVSKVYLITNIDVDAQKQYEALYSFGQVTERSDTEGGLSFDDWLASKKIKYATTQY